MWCIPDRRARRAAASAAVCALLAGCGFHPLHGSGGGATASDAATLATIQIAPIADRSGQQLHNLLLDRLTPRGGPQAPRYVLSVRLAESRRNIALRSDETPTRVTLTLTATFTLSPVGEAREFRGSAVSANGYNVLRSEFATLASERDTRRRLLDALSEQISLRVAAALRNPAMFRARAPAPKPAKPARI